MAKSTKKVRFHLLHEETQKKNKYCFVNTLDQQFALSFKVRQLAAAIHDPVFLSAPSTSQCMKNLLSILPSKARCMRCGQRRPRLHFSPFLTCGIDVAGGGGGGGVGWYLPPIRVRTV